MCLTFSRIKELSCPSFFSFLLFFLFPVLFSPSDYSLCFLFKSAILSFLFSYICFFPLCSITIQSVLFLLVFMFLDLSITSLLSLLLLVLLSSIFILLILLLVGNNLWYGTSCSFCFPFFLSFLFPSILFLFFLCFLFAFPSILSCFLLFSLFSFMYPVSRLFFTVDLLLIFVVVHSYPLSPSFSDFFHHYYYFLSSLLSLYS